MRVLVVTSLFPNDAQPHKAPFNRQQIEALADIADVRVIAPVPFTKMLRRGVQSVTTKYASGRERSNGLLVSHPTYFFTPKVMRGAYGSFFVKSIAREFERCVEQFRPDIVLGCWAYPDGWAAMHLARRHGLPVALKIQGSDVLQVGDRGVRARRVCEVLRGVDLTLVADTSQAYIPFHGTPTVLLVGRDKAAQHFFLGGRKWCPFREGERSAWVNARVSTS